MKRSPSLLTSTLLARPLLLAPLMAGGLLVSCSQSSPGGSGGSSRPELPTGIEVRFPAQSADSYLSLLNGAGENVYQVSVPAGKTSVEVDSSKWAAQSAGAQDVLKFLPEGAGPAGLNAEGRKVNLLHWVMWQDRNSNGRLEEGEALDLMTHDRVAYASDDTEVKFSTPDMAQVWKLRKGWSRAEHYVYLPKGSTTYQRRLETAQVQRYELHVPTPVTSQ